MTEIRDIGYLKWKDEWAWMETMKGKKWENVIEKEKKHFNELASQVKKEARQMETEIKTAQEYSKLPAFKIGGTIDITLIPNSRFYWNWSWSKKKKPAYTFKAPKSGPRVF